MFGCRRSGRGRKFLSDTSLMSLRSLSDRGGSALVTGGPITDAFIACRKRLAQIVARIVPPQEIEDIVQETYVKVCEYTAHSQVTEPRALMLTVARNLALDHVRRSEYKLTRRFENDLDMELIFARDATDQSYHQAAAHEEFSRFCDAIRQLPMQCRRVFVLKKVYGYSQREIATELGISENTVEKHVAAGLQQCVRHMRINPELKNATGGGRGRVVGTRGSL
jgi:RNA polymerase sigma factor (sigma-70 family)